METISSYLMHLPTIPKLRMNLQKKSGLTIDEVSSMLLILELDGVIDALPGGRFCKLGS